MSDAKMTCLYEVDCTGDDLIFTISNTNARVAEGRLEYDQDKYE